jgi:hypothetical protein
VDEARLIVIRGNSGAGKTSVALGLRQAYGRGVAWVSQDMIRRTILRDFDHPGARNIGLIEQVVRYSLAHDYHVVLDGILDARRYEPMLAGLRQDHPGPSSFYYLDISFDESLRRHDTRGQRAEFGAAEMRRWYRPRDLLTTIPEAVMRAGAALAASFSAPLWTGGPRPVISMSSHSAPTSSAGSLPAPSTSRPASSRRTPSRPDRMAAAASALCSARPRYQGRTTTGPPR